MKKYLDSLALFNNDLKHIRKIDESEINDYIVLAQKGDISARNRIIESNIDLVKKVAGVYCKKEENYLEFVQVGIIGLFDAIDNYSPEKAKFSSYAIFWIKDKIINEIYKNTNPFNSYRLTYYLNKYNKLIQSNDKISDMEICKNLNISKKILDLVKQYNKTSFVSGDETFYKDSNSEYKLIDYVEDNNDLYEKLNNNLDFKTFLAMAKYKLSRFEYYVIYNKGLNKSLEKIGEPLNIKKARIGHVYLNSISKINSVLNDEKEYKNITNILKTNYGDIYKLNISCPGVDEICLYLYLRNKITNEESQLLFNKWFSLMPVENNYSNKKELLHSVRYKLENIDNNDFNNYRNSLIKEFGTIIFKLIDISVNDYDTKKHYPEYVKKYIKKYY